jgi:uncharacterized membrane protein
MRFGAALQKVCRGLNDLAGMNGPPMSWYRHKVGRDLARWQTAGWVNEAGASAIRSDLASRRSPFAVAPIFAMLGAVLFGCAAMSFVAAHWTAMSKLARLALLLAGLWGCYGAAFALFHRQLNAFAQAAVLGGIAVFGASIMLIAQMYHLEGNPPDAVLTWALGALLAAVLIRSRPALAATFVLMVVWSNYERSLADAAHWEFLPAWAAAAAVAAWLGWRPGLHLAAISLGIWLVPLGFFLLDHHAHWITAAIGALAAVSAAAAGPAIDRRIAASAALFAYAIIVAFAGLYVFAFVDESLFYRLPDRSWTPQLVLLAALTLVLLLAAMLWALISDNRGALWLAYGGFALEVFSLYVKTMGTLLDTSLFFLIAALMVSTLAWAAYTLHRRLSSAGVSA